MLSGKHKFKILQHYGYVYSDSTAVGLESDPSGYNQILWQGYSYEYKPV